MSNWARALCFGLLVVTTGSCGGTTPGEDLVGPGSRCEERAAFAIETVEAVRAQHLRCTDSSECRLFDPSTLCRGACPAPIHVSGLAAAERAIDQIDLGTCRDFAEDGCPFATPACLRIEPVCREGRCVGVPHP